MTWTKPLALAILAAFIAAHAPLRAAPPAGPEAALKAADITGKLFPEHVFFRAQVAPVQMRNTAGIRFADDFYVLAGLVDNSGYAADIRQKYQAYLISEVVIDIGGQKLQPGAYGVGFIADNKFIVMDLGAHDLFQTPSAHDAEMKRPVPMQVTSTGGKYRLYKGRDYVEIERAQ
ncbi:MAG TPA: hypothetical protein VK466_09975 [Terriglobales bacterium]|nr:hypothetical protein [Terriglobales bacterium]